MRPWKWALAGVGALVAGAGLFVAHVDHSVQRTVLLDAGHTTVNGPVTVLLVGIDRRPGQPVDASRADSIIMVHVTADHRHAYLVSLPRDTLVPIAGHGENKINSAFTDGSEHNGGAAGGVRLLARTITTSYGIRFDAAAMVDFTGFQQVVSALGGVTMCIDERTTSIHAGHTADGQEKTPFTEDSAGRLHPVPGVTPVVYQPGCQHLTAAQALDYVRQRNLLADGDGDYGRQRHQQQFLEAVLRQVDSAGTLTDPIRLDHVLTALGHAMTIDTGGVGLPDWIYTMRGLTSDNLRTVKTNDGQYDTIDVPGVGSSQRLTPASVQLMHAVSTDSVGAFLTTHPGWSAATPSATPPRPAS